MYREGVDGAIELAIAVHGPRVGVLHPTVVDRADRCRRMWPLLCALTLDVSFGTCIRSNIGEWLVIGRDVGQGAPTVLGLGQGV